jgi:CubicO group peptidase (beta-lactamase class C family)
MPDNKTVNFHKACLVYKLIIVILFTLSSNVFANELNTKEELNITLENIRIQNNIPAMAVVIISSGEVSFIQGFGFLDDAKLKPTTKDSLFRVASISKLFTAQAIMQLVEKNQLKLDDNIGKYLPIFKSSNITIKQLLTHSSGVSDIIRPEGIDTQRSEFKYLELVKKSAVNNFNNKTFEYSDTGFNILGSIISVVSGVSYTNYVDQNILVPAGMDKSWYFNGVNENISEAPPTYKGKLINKSEQRPFDTSFNPSEGLVASVNDLMRWLQLTLAHDSSLLKEQSYKKMLKPQVKTFWGGIYMGLGWQVYERDGVNIARHPGGIRGYKSLVLTYPEKKDAIILLTNSSDTPRWEIAKAITKILKNNSEW